MALLGPRGGRVARRTGERRRLLAPAGAALCAFVFGITLGALLDSSGDAGEAETNSPSPVVIEQPEVTAPSTRTPVERSSSGAAEVAARALSALADPRLLSDRAARRGAVADLAPAAYRAQLTPLFDRTYDYLADIVGRPSTSGEVVLRMAPVGYRVEAFSRRRATVAVWHVTLLGTPDRDPIAAWATSRAELVWAGGRWRVERFGQDVPGPTPAVTAPSAPTSPAEFVGVANSMEPFAR